MAPQRFAFVSLLALVLVPPATAQSAVHLGVGRSSYDLSGVGTTWALVNARWTLRVAGPFHVESGATFYRYNAQFGQRVSYLMPEVSGVLRASIDELSVYLAAGAGLGVGIESDHRVRVTVHGATGLELRPDPRWGLRFEGRLRSFPWGSVMADLTAGPTFRF